MDAFLTVTSSGLWSEERYLDVLWLNYPSQTDGVMCYVMESAFKVNFTLQNEIVELPSICGTIKVLLQKTKLCFYPPLIDPGNPNYNSSHGSECSWIPECILEWKAVGRWASRVLTKSSHPGSIFIFVLCCPCKISQCSVPGHQWSPVVSTNVGWQVTCDAVSLTIIFQTLNQTYRYLQPGVQFKYLHLQTGIFWSLSAVH